MTFHNTMHMANPIEALLQTIITITYGCTHFIVGNTHAGLGMEKSGKPFYKSNDAQKLEEEYSEEIDIKIISFDEMIYL